MLPLRLQDNLHSTVTAQLVPKFSRVFDPSVPHQPEFNRFQTTLEQSEKAKFDRIVKLGNAFVSSFRQEKKNYSGHIEDSWPKKLTNFECLLDLYQVEEDKALKLLPTMFTGDARVFYGDHFKENIND
ncbi:hypothetical protein BWQ96_08419 [Gracilariopsis chorda]|uniref:Uncharacterized protein n=1 Tax=Gracilariopsis chorda TaxID=448386 RepID=A0A2V3IIH1_9FLOR|nr:hypothetical protein BWQ96_08419 [Gracilariopsis chorda]|eukprot:PXF41859.1 hypothetical protein BWQ96_08419 [Gracilariopsis chorda]